MALTIDLLGDVAVAIDGRPLPIPRAQVQVALARLTLERETGTGRHELADTIWPEDLPATWSSALRSIVSRIRRLLRDAGLDDDMLVVNGGTYRLALPQDTVVDLELAVALTERANQHLDAGAHEQCLEAAEWAVDLLRRPFLPFHEGEWAEAARSRAEERRLIGLELAARSALETGRWQRSLMHSDEAIRLQPLRESAHRCRMLAHRMAGNRGEALRAYQMVRTLLAEELGVDPSSETEDLYLELLWSHNDSQPQPVVGERVLVRDRERDLIARTLGLHDGVTRSKLVVVEGEPGSGKSELASDVAALAQRNGVTVLVGSGFVDRPLGAVLSALANYLVSTPAEARPRWSPAVRELLCTVVGHSDEPTAVTPSPLALASLAESIRGIARRGPLLLVIDGLDPDDWATIDVLAELVDRHNGGPVLGLMTVSTSARATTGDRRIDDLVVRASAERVVLRGLDEGQVRRVVEAYRLPGDPLPLTRELGALSGGNPFLIRALLHGWRLAGGVKVVPPSIVRYAGRRLEGSSPEAQRFLSVAAVMGPVFQPEVVAEVMGIGDGAGERLGAYWTFQGVTEEPTTISLDRGSLDWWERPGQRFRHEVLRHVLYRQISPAERRSIHDAIARVIERRLGDGPADPADIQSIARHQLAATRGLHRAGAVRWAWRAAETVDAIGALKLYREAVERAPADNVAVRVEAQRRLAMAERRVGLDGWTDRLFDAAVDGVAAGQVEQAARAAHDLAVSGPAGADRRTAALLQVVLDTDADNRQRGRPVLDDLLRARVVARCILAGGSIPRRIRRHDQALQALAEALEGMRGAAQLGTRKDHAHELCALARSFGFDDAFGPHHQAMAAAMSGDDLALRSALSCLRRVASETPWVERALAESSIALGDPTRWPAGGRGDEEPTLTVMTGRTHIRRRVRLGGTDGEPLGPAMTHHNGLIVQWLDQRPLVAPPGFDVASNDPVDRSSALLLALSQGERVRASTIASSLIFELPTLWTDDAAGHVAGVLGLVVAELGDERLAETLRMMLSPWADQTCGVGYRSFVGPMSYHLGRLAMVNGAWYEAELHLDRAVASLSRRRTGPWVALAHQALRAVLERRSVGPTALAGSPGR